MEKKRRRWLPGGSAVLPLGFLIIILAGTGLLMLPVSSRQGSLGFFDALFTAVSATCVTGLTVVDTGRWFTDFGHAVLLILIQIGGLGFMTLASYMFQTMRRRVSMRDRMVLEETVGRSGSQSAGSIAGAAVKLTLLTEGLGALLLSFRFVPQFNWGRGIWYAIFHSVSAFCNAGFDLMGGGVSLTDYAGDPLVMGTVMALIIIGGLGFIVLQDLRRPKKGRGPEVHTRLVLMMSGGLILGGTLLFLLIEWNNPGTLGGKSVGEKVLAALFQSVTCRTAGFNSIDQAQLRDASKALSAALMFIGAAPAGTAGGIKVTTAAVLFLELRALLRNRQDAEAFGFRVSRDAARRALGLFVGAGLLAFASVMVLSLQEPQLSMIDLLYECVSALGTVGLSCGVTAQVSLFGRGLLCLLMYVGRIGLLSLLFMLSGQSRPEVLRRPEGQILIG